MLTRIRLVGARSFERKSFVLLCKLNLITYCKRDVDVEYFGLRRKKGRAFNGSELGRNRVGSLGMFQTIANTKH